MAIPGRTPARRRIRHPAVLALVLALAPPFAARQAGAQNAYVQTNLVSDVPGLAATLDPQLVNPWGVSFGPTTPFWVSDAGTGVTTLYNGAGEKQGLVVTIPGPGGGVPSVPTGQVFNGDASAFMLSNGQAARFIFAGATGTISGWNGAAGTTAMTVVNGAPDASYTGLAIATSGAGPRLYGANFASGQVDVFDGTFTQIATPGGFADPTLPAGYAPFNVQTLGGEIYVSYAVFDPSTGEDLPGAGNGIVNVFDTDGNLLRHLTAGGPLNSPWGLTLAPSGFGAFGGSLLVGNFGDGTIHAFDPVSGALLGQMLAPGGTPIVNEGLWALTFGNGGNGGSPDILYFTAGIEDETHGLFGSLEVATVPEPATLSLVAGGLGLVGLAAARRRRRQQRG
ncbi:MAG TPA: TIGR03118 family protein [Gemmatimonadaceae bacterium]|nr:TIGR03118 family protein [Gemmatimonadaceae bacterium]